MAEKTSISALPAALTPDGTERIPMDQDGQTVHGILTDLLTSGMEYGSNTNGQYVRLANGVQVCWGYVNIGSVPADSGGSSTFTFPMPFEADTPNSDIAVVGTGSEHNSAGGARYEFRTSTLYAQSETTGYAAVVNESGFEITMKLTYFAIGRWKAES